MCLGQSAGNLAPACDHMLVKLSLCLLSLLAAFLCLPLLPPDWFLTQIQSHLQSSHSSLCPSPRAFHLFFTHFYLCLALCHCCPSGLPSRSLHPPPFFSSSSMSPATLSPISLSSFHVKYFRFSREISKCLLSELSV